MMAAIVVYFHLLVLLTAKIAQAWTTTTRSPPPQRYLPSFFSSVTLTEATASSLSDIQSILNDIKNDDSLTFPLLRIGRRVGSGSYGTVHEGYFITRNATTAEESGIQHIIAKRAWTFNELEANIPTQIFNFDQEKRSQQEEKMAVAQRTGLAVKSLPITNTNNDNNGESLHDDADVKMKYERCKHYYNVEKHCYQKLTRKKEGSSSSKSKNDATTPIFLGVHQDDGKTTIDDYNQMLSSSAAASDRSHKTKNVGHEWMVFEYISSSSSSIMNDSGSTKPAITLLDAISMASTSRQQKRAESHHCLYEIQIAMSLPQDYTFGDALDVIFTSLLENLVDIHKYNIVHRDVKPGNLLCANQRLYLFDFGSAADLDPTPIAGGPGSILGGKKRIGYDDGYAAISPIYSAPEIFIKLAENPLSFDVFSAGLILCQLIFNLLDERTDVGFLQQLKDVNYDLDSWLENELRAKLRPSGLENGLEYFGERRGLWTLMKGMLQKDPTKRISSTQALKQLKQIIALRFGGEIDDRDDSMVMEEIASDEEYFGTVIESLDSCTLPNLSPENMPRPLHFLASFKKGFPVGLILAEASEVVDDGTLINGEWDQWQRATQYFIPGEVFVKGWDTSSQAGLLGIFEIGDRLRGVGELPFVDGGFEQAIKLINRQPKGGSLKLHFDRIPTPKKVVATKSDMAHNLIKVVDQGAWKSGGRRGNQEDAFVLHEIPKNGGNLLLLSGVFDGHAGTAASETVSHILPPLFTTDLVAADTIRDALEKSWDTTCNTYRDGCDEHNGECLASYDPINGILYAQTGSKDLVAGTTATIAVMSLNPSGTDELTILNCGDSRTLVIGQPTEGNDSVIIFATRDHSPDDIIEIERLEQGQAAGMDYSIPQCSASNGSYMVVGDYQYALCRSLEGSYVTSKGIVSDPDITTLDLANCMAGREYCALVLACDGLFEVMDNEEVGREVIRMRQEGYMAGDIAKNLCGQALKKGSYDNLSVIVIYLDNAD